MKKIPISSTAMVAVTSSAMALEAISVHNQVNNVQTPAHQVQSSAIKSIVEEENMKMMDINGHDETAMSREMMQNSDSAVHQDTIEVHKKMMNAKPRTTGETTKSFSEMGEYEEATVAHKKANNGQFSVAYQQ